MSETAIDNQQQGFVEAELNYVADDGIPPVQYIDWPEMEPEAHPPVYEPHKMRIENGRPMSAQFTLASHGYALATRKSDVQDFYDDAEIKRVYYPETEQIIKDYSGATRVFVFDHTLRTANEKIIAENSVRPPVMAVHNDYTEDSARQRVRDFFPDEAEALLKRRFAIIQTWRPVGHAIERDPLAMCDGTTIPEEGFLLVERRYRNRTAKVYHIAHNPAHHWYYFPHQTTDEVIVFKVFDTDASAGVKFSAHTAFDDPTSKPDARPRESIEMRALVFFD